MIVFGTRMFGDVSNVPDLFYVGTRFFHIWYIPLIPVGSFLVLEDTDAGFRGVPIGLSFRSIFTAWFRTFFVLLALLCIGLSIYAVFTGTPDLLGMLAWEVFQRDLSDLVHIPWIAQTVIFYGLMLSCIFVGIVTYWGSHRFARASYKRAVALAQETGISKALVDHAFGKAIDVGAMTAESGPGFAEAPYASGDDA